MFNLTRKTALKYAAVAGGALTGAAANAQGAVGLPEILAAVDLSAIAAPVGAAAVTIVTIALIFKGPALAKRIISKV